MQRPDYKVEKKEGGIKVLIAETEAIMSNAQQDGEEIITPTLISKLVYNTKEIAREKYLFLGHLKHKNMPKIVCWESTGDGNRIAVRYYGQPLNEVVQNVEVFWIYDDEGRVVAPTRVFLDFILELVDVIQFLKNNHASIDEEDILTSIAVLEELKNPTVIKFKEVGAAEELDEGTILSRLLQAIVGLQNLDLPNEFTHFMEELQRTYSPGVDKMNLLLNNHPVFATSKRKWSDLRRCEMLNEVGQIDQAFFTRNGKRAFHQGWRRRASQEKSDFSERVALVSQQGFPGFLQFGRATFAHLNEYNMVNKRRLKNYVIDDVCYVLERVAPKFFIELFELNNQSR